MSRISKLFSNENLFFTSDTHFFHRNIIEYCNRPFGGDKEMNETIIKKWNEEVPKDGIVFHLGDFSLNGKSLPLKEIIDSLNGTIYLVVGNHEKDVLSRDEIRERFASIDDILEIKVEDKELAHNFQHIVLCHYPMITWNAAHRGSWQLFGHVHGKLPDFKLTPNQMDVGVDCHNFYPLSYQEVKSYITKKNLGNE